MKNQIKCIAIWERLVKTSLAAMVLLPMISPHTRGQDASEIEWAPVGTTWQYEF